MSEATAPPPARVSKRPLIGALVGSVIVVVSAVAAGAFFAGRAAGDAEGKNVDVIKTKREMLRKIENSAVDAEAQVAQLKPAVLALQAKETKLEADNAAALDRLRAHWEVDCGNDNVKFTTPAAPPEGAVALGEALRGEYPCGGDGAGFMYAQEPKVSLDVVAFGEFSGGACAGATLVRVTLNCSFIEFNQNCGGDSDGCERFKAPEPTYRLDDEWGCIRDSGVPGGKSSLTEPANCPDVVHEEDGVAHQDVAHLVWALRGSQAVYLSGSSDGWAELGEAEPAPGAKHVDALKLAFRSDEGVNIVVEEFPETFLLEQGQLDAVGAERMDLNVPGEGKVVGDSSVVSDEGDGAWKRVSRDGRARLYKERLDRTHDFSAAAELIKGVVVGDEHYCSRTDRKPGAGLTKVGTDKDGADLWVEGTPQPGTLGVVLWTSPFGNLWSCNNRVTGPYGANEGDPEWEDPTTDADREQYPWCF